MSDLPLDMAHPFEKQLRLKVGHALPMATIIGCFRFSPSGTDAAKIMFLDFHASELRRRRPNPPTGHSKTSLCEALNCASYIFAYPMSILGFARRRRRVTSVASGAAPASVRRARNQPFRRRLSCLRLVALS